MARARALPYELLDVEARRFEEEDYGRVFKVFICIDGSDLPFTCVCWLGPGHV